MDAATALASVCVMLCSDGINDVASVVTVWIVPNFSIGARAVHIPDASVE